MKIIHFPMKKSCWIVFDWNCLKIEVFNSSTRSNFYEQEKLVSQENKNTQIIESLSTKKLVHNLLLVVTKERKNTDI